VAVVENELIWFRCQEGQMLPAQTKGVPDSLGRSAEELCCSVCGRGLLVEI